MSVFDEDVFGDRPWGDIMMDAPAAPAHGGGGAGSADAPNEFDLLAENSRAGINAFFKQVRVRDGVRGWRTA